jgi:uncharacterized repeat protein (TIGR03843 family)
VWGRAVGKIYSINQSQGKSQNETGILRGLADVLLQNGNITQCRMLYAGSNGVFLISLENHGRKTHAIYKPRAGESPLWDFPDGTLCLRERAAYLISEVLGWSIVPPTVLRQGPHGIGAVQWFVNFRTEAYHELREQHREDLKKIAAFDWVVNNADRKAGHCLLGEDGHIWGIDHGLTFHAQPKLRTVIWDFGGEPIPGRLVQDLKSLLPRLKEGEQLHKMLSQLLAEEEVEALSHRLQIIISRPFFPMWSGSYRSIPWPPY